MSDVVGVRRAAAKKAKAKTKAENLQKLSKHCAFLSIPPELRNRIYQYVLIEEPYIDINTSAEEKEGAQPALTRTCHQIRDETLPVLFGRNTFRFSLRGQSFNFGPVTASLHRLVNVQIAFCTHGTYYHLHLDKHLGKRALYAVMGGRWSSECEAVCGVKVEHIAAGREYLLSTWLLAWALMAMRYLRLALDYTNMLSKASFGCCKGGCRS